MYKLSKAHTYSIPQALRAWNFLDALKSMWVLIIRIYVDDLIVIGDYKVESSIFKKQMSKKFEISDLGLLSFYLDIEVRQWGDDISLKQSAY